MTVKVTQVTSLRVLGGVDDPATYPMAKGRHSLDTLREHQHLRMRSNVVSPSSGRIGMFGTEDSPNRSAL